MRRRYLRKREGFTLIELLIVLAIIGALMSIGIPIYQKALENANATVIAANMRTIADGVRLALSLEGTATTQPEDYIELDATETTNYEINIEKDNTHNPPVWTVTVTYKGDMASAERIKSKLKGCSDADIDGNNHVYCEINVPKVF